MDTLLEPQVTTKGKIDNIFNSVIENQKLLEKVKALGRNLTLANGPLEGNINPYFYLQNKIMLTPDGKIITCKERSYKDRNGKPLFKDIKIYDPKKGEHITPEIYDFFFPRRPFESIDKEVQKNIHPFLSESSSNES